MSCPPNRGQGHRATSPPDATGSAGRRPCRSPTHDRLMVRMGILAAAHNQPEIADDDSYLAGIHHDRVPNVMLPAGLKHLKVSKAGQNRILSAEELHARPRSDRLPGLVRFFFRCGWR